MVMFSFYPWDPRPRRIADTLIKAGASIELICLEDEPSALRFFESLSDSEKKYYIQWIFGAKRVETKIARMAKAISRLSRKLKMYQREDE